MIKVSYAVPVCTELQEIQKLVEVLTTSKQKQDEIVILFDKNNGSKEVSDYLDTLSSVKVVKSDSFKNDFSEWKNELISLCSGDYVFQIDADEFPSEQLLKSLHKMLEENPDSEMIAVPRINIVHGLTYQHLQAWKWQVEADGAVNYPDYQMRIHKNDPKIKWANKVHEQLIGFNLYSIIPSDRSYKMYLQHDKTIERQVQQNLKYQTLI